MDDEFDRRCSLLGEAWQWWATTLQTLDPPGWEAPTRLAGWNVDALVAHHGMLVQGLAFLASQPASPEAHTRTAAEMLRRFNAPDGVANTATDVVADMARQQAASRSTDELAAAFADGAPETVRVLRAAGPINVDYFGNGTFPLAEAVLIATMEAVVHGLDLAQATERDGRSLPAGAIAATIDLLADVPDPVRFIEAATGRTSNPVLPVLR